MERRNVLKLLVFKERGASMENLLFTYNLVLTIIFTIVLTGFYILRIRNKKKEYFFLTLLFIVMIADNSFLYITDFSDSFTSLYETSTFLYVVLDMIYVSFIIVSRLYIQSHFKKEMSKTERNLLVVIPLTIVIMTYGLNEALSEGLTYLFFYSGIIYLVQRCYVSLKNRAKEEGSERGTQVIYNAVAFTFLLLCFFGVLDSVLFVVGKSVSVLGSLEYVYIPFVLIKILICGAGLKHLLKIFAVQDSEASSKSDSGSKSVTEQVNDFGVKHELTPRQIEIIVLIVGGSTNREISDALHITEGTVKAHVYNIFKKTEVSSRGQLIGKILGE